MKDYTYRSFRIKAQQFSVTQYNDGRIYVRSIHPYDETEYHWAYHPGTEDAYWGIYLEGNFVARSRDFYDGVEVTPEQIAEELLDCDKAAIEKIEPQYQQEAFAACVAVILEEMQRRHS